MRIYAAIAILASVPGGLGVALPQSCATPITSWSGSYTLNATASQVACSPPYICTISQSVSAALTSQLQVSSCSLLNVLLNGNIISASVDDTAVGTDPCTMQGNSGAAPTDNNFLMIYPTSGTYSLVFEPYAAVTGTPSGCGGGDPAIGLAPQTNWPWTSTLPASVGPLTATGQLFSGQVWFYNAPSDWTFGFTLTPIYNPDDPCKEDGGQGDPVGSSIGCQSQSLGEDIPITGTGFNLHYESNRHQAAYGNSVASADASMIGGWTLSVHHAYDPSTNTLFLGDGTQRNGYQLGTPVAFNGHLLLTSEDGSEVYVFTSAGQQLKTQRPLTGALEYQFGYDAAGNLVTVTDGSGNVTTIQRNASEQATAIVSPYGQSTTLAVDSAGLLNQVTDPLGKSQTFVNTSTGLLSSRTDANGNTFIYTYDTSSGTLSKDSDPLGGYIMLGRTNATSGFGWTVSETTSMDRASSYQSTFTMPWVQGGAASYSEQQTNIWPDGLQAASSTSLNSGLLSKQATLPDGTSDSRSFGPDPVWGIQAPVETSETLTQGNLTMNITGSRSTTLGTAGNPFTVTTEADTQIMNGRTYTSTFTGSNRTWVNTSPVNRTLTVALDSLERIASTQIEGLTAMDFAYDSSGRLLSATQGTRKTTLGYNTDGFLSGVTDPLKLTTGLGYDADGHVLNTTLPDGRITNFAYDANGNLTSVTPPGKPGHEFAYNAVNLPESYTPPAVPGTGATTYGYNLDRDLTSITRPDGKTITYGYDNAGRLTSIGTPTGTTKFTYNPTTGNPASAVRGVEALASSYNGPLPTKSTWTGTVAGTVNHAYNDNFWISSQSVGGGSTIALKYDNDGLLIGAGSLAIKRNPKNGLIAGTTLGASTDSRTYNGFGELIAYTASVSGVSIYTQSLTRDADSRVKAKSETVSGTNNTYSYTYDPAGRLTGVTKNSATDTYTYDSNSNRLTATTPAGTAGGTYDAQDRLLTYGTATYTYTANGELTSQTAGAQTTTYTYDVLGNLIAATLPNGTKISYIVDAENHRVGKEVNGVSSTGFLYDGDQMVAQLNGSNQLVSQFVYGTTATSPDYMVSGGTTYRIFSDQLGSPVLVVNTSTGAIAEQIAYDEFGNVISDTNPGFQPFGFAGGIYDQDTKLVRFGARDYDPSIGRWTAKDPTLFDGGDTNLYSYVLNDPVNLSDPTGLSIYRVDATQWVQKQQTKGLYRVDASKLVDCQKCKQKEPKNPKSTKNKPPIIRMPPMAVTGDPGASVTLTIDFPDGTTVIMDDAGTLTIGPAQPVIVMPPMVVTGVCRP
ncbi:MAG TPA: RHS repeat-associated core domain-containing protein [Bryobacteraceae bacterium]|nr:RHS repeat-associated core domain-containing protein [Bryobacteraceae bacterium]